MKNGWFLILFFGALVLNFSCSKEDGCTSVEDEQQKEGMTLMIVKFKQRVFFNTDYIFEAIPGQPSPRSNYFKNYFVKPPNSYNTINFPTSYESYIPLPIDRNEYSFIINYKNTIKDTILFKYDVELFYHHDDCDPSFYYPVINLKSYSASSNFIELISVHENY